ncbi:MAG: TadE/TadG family type IV pilus assembly protein [Pseudomonadota bacterium]
MGTRIGLTGLTRSFWRNRRGATVVEFAIIAPVFFGLTFSILEAGFYFFVTSAVDAANTKAARLIRTGQAVNGGRSKQQFYDEICKTVKFVGDCSSRLTVDVARFNNFSDLAADTSNPTCADASAADITNIPYDTGADRDIIRVRVCFIYDGFNPGVGLNLEKSADGKGRKMISTSIFRNEPF